MEASRSIVTGTAINSLADLFPPSQRVIYDRAPLTQVVCQLRFPPILRIESQPPADFQERVRKLFPLLERVQTQLPPDLPPEVVQIIGLGNIGLGGNFAFQTEDRSSTLNLSSSHISLSTTRYGKWDQFSELFWPALDALLEIYSPAFFQRIGLRYINIIERSAVDMADRSWSDLLRKEVLGEIALKQFELCAIELNKNIRLKSTTDGCALFFQHGFLRRTPASEVGYRLDFDFYQDQKTEVTDAKSTINSLNSMVGRAFRWCITEPLHQSLGPSPI